MSKQKVTFWIEEGEVGFLKEKFNTDNQSEAIRLAILQSLTTGDLEKIKTLFPYIGKKPPRIGRLGQDIQFAVFNPSVGQGF